MGILRLRNWWCAVCVAVALATATGNAAVIVDDSWTDGGRDDGADPLDSNWWTSSSSSGIEVSVGSLGLVTGTSGRGIHTIFPSQSLAPGDSIKATFDFTTPATIGTGKGTSFRIGLFDDLGRAGLNDNVSASSSSPNALYNILPGYMVALDVGTGTEDINFREHDTAGTGTGRLMATTSNFSSVGTGGDPYSFAASTDYTGVLELTMLSATDMELSFSLSDASGVLSSYTDTDSSLSASSFAMFGFHVNSNVFGSTNARDTPDNGIDFTNIVIEVNQIPEPSMLSLLAAASLSFAAIRRR